MRFVATDPTTLTIRFQGLECVWVLRRTLVVSRGDVNSINYIPELPVMQDFKGYLRLFGTALPWLFLAGTYWGGGKREFWFVRMKQPGLLTIELTPGKDGYQRLRLSCNPVIAQDVVDWWKGKSS